MKLTLYPLVAGEMPIRPAEPRRDWMDAAREAFPYRCLPLALANQHGWEVFTPFDFEAEWNGGELPADVVVRSAQPIPQGSPGAPLANFGEGVLTFELSFMLRTPEGWNTFVTGPMNGIKDGIAPLSGVIETDWSPYSFTMNWRFTRPGKVRFSAGEAVAKSHSRPGNCPSASDQASTGRPCTMSGSKSARPDLRTRFVSPLEILKSAGSDSAKSTSRKSRNGSRLSTELAMELRSAQCSICGRPMPVS